MNELLAKLGLEDKGAVAQCLWDMNQMFDQITHGFLAGYVVELSDASHGVVKPFDAYIRHGFVLSRCQIVEGQ
jgi:hypothetical protein